jgi:hypothetical protein
MHFARAFGALVLLHGVIANGQGPRGEFPILCMSANTNGDEAHGLVRRASSDVTAPTSSTPPAQTTTAKDTTKESTTSIVQCSYFCGSL